MFCPYKPPYIVAVLLFLTSSHLFPTVFYLFQVKGLIFREQKAHRLNRTNDGESQPSNWLNKKNSSAGAAYFLIHFKVVAARLSRVPTDAAIRSHAAPGHIFDRLKVRAFKGSVQTSNGSKFRVNRAKLLNGSVLTQWPVKCLSRSKIRPVTLERNPRSPRIACKVAGVTILSLQSIPPTFICDVFPHRS